MTELDINSLSHVTGGVGLLAKAKDAAVRFSAGQNAVHPRQISVTKTTNFGFEGRNRSFGISLNNGELLDVKLTPKRGLLRGISYLLPAY
jgi:hypothetical protein